jgi:hypothetical protein
MSFQSPILYAVEIGLLRRNIFSIFGEYQLTEAAFTGYFDPKDEGDAQFLQTWVWMIMQTFNMGNPNYHM